MFEYTSLSDSFCFRIHITFIQEFAEKCSKFTFIHSAVRIYCNNKKIDECIWENVNKISVNVLRRLESETGCLS